MGLSKGIVEGTVTKVDKKDSKWGDTVEVIVRTTAGAPMKKHNDVKIKGWGFKMNGLDKLQKGQAVSIQVEIKGNEWEGKHFLTLEPMDVRVTGGVLDSKSVAEDAVLGQATAADETPPDAEMPF